MFTSSAASVIGVVSDSGDESASLVEMSGGGSESGATAVSGGDGAVSVTAESVAAVSAGGSWVESLGGAVADALESVAGWLEVPADAVMSSPAPTAIQSNDSGTLCV